MSNYFDIAFFETKPTIDEMMRLDAECEQLTYDIKRQAVLYANFAQNLCGPLTDIVRKAMITNQGLIRESLINEKIKLFKTRYQLGGGLICNRVYGSGLTNFEESLACLGKAPWTDPTFSEFFLGCHNINKDEYAELRIVLGTLIRYYFKIGSITNKIEQGQNKIVPVKSFKSCIFDILTCDLVGISEYIANIIKEENARTECIKIRNNSEGYYKELVGISPEWLEVLENIGEAAEYISDQSGNGNAVKKSILIKGPTGVGKENIVNAIAKLIGRKKVLSVNCSFFGSLTVSELFGYMKDSHSNAFHDTKGLCHAAEGKILFLDEIHTTLPVHQPKLLKLIEAHKFLRLGATEEESFKGIIIAAINQDVRGLVKEGKLLVDLYHRLNRCHINVPKLSTRLSDVEELIIHFIHSQHKDLKISVETIEEICNFFMSQAEDQDDPLAGNVRELQNMVAELVLKRKRLNKKLNIDGKDIQSDLLPSEYRKLPFNYSRSYYRIPEPPRGGDHVNYLNKRDAVRLKSLPGTNKGIIARLLGVTERTVRNRLADSKNASTASKHQAKKIIIKLL